MNTDKKFEILDGDQIRPEHLFAVRKDGITFIQCVDACLDTPELVKQFDRLWGTNLLRAGAPIDLAIDVATGRQHSDMNQFLKFVWNCIFIRVNPCESVVKK